MKWNWQQDDWPNFTWNAARLAIAEQQFLIRGGVLVGSIKHLGDDQRGELMVECMSTEAITTSQIEGEVLDRASVQSSLQKQLGLATDDRRATPAEQGIAEMMVDLCQHFDAELSDDMLFRWHAMLMAGRTDVADIGLYRTSDEPMQIVPAVIGSTKVYFEAPPSVQVIPEMQRFLQWLRRTARSGTAPLSPLTRAGIAHLYFESIHPFEDGNGRIGRAISEKCLAQGLEQSIFTMLAPTILGNQASYYEALEAASARNEVTNWLAWFAGIALEAQSRTISSVEFIIDKTKLLDRARGQINDRQEKSLLRMLREGPQGFKGGLSAGNYAKITGASAATTTRDLADLMEKNLLVRTGELRHARYHLAIPIHKTPRITVQADGNLLES
jgi:Fic family protein